MNVQSNLLKYPKLTKESFPGLRDTICLEKLKRLAEQAEKIPIVDLMNTIVDGELYLQLYNLLFHSTMGPRIQSYFFLKNILPRIRDKDRMLDVGVGDGTFLKWYGRQFSTIWVVDNNKAVLDNFNMTKKILPNNVKIKKILGAIEDQVLPKNYFNLCTLSHVLYYIPRNQWDSVIDSVYRAMIPDGIIAIVFNDGYKGKDKLLRTFGGRSLLINDFIAICTKKYSTNFEVYRISEDYYARSLKHMLHLAIFLLMDIKAVAARKDLEKYIIENYQCGDHFVMSSETKILLITKK